MEFFKTLEVWWDVWQMVPRLGLQSQPIADLLIECAFPRLRQKHYQMEKKQFKQFLWMEIARKNSLLTFFLWGERVYFKFWRKKLEQKNFNSETTFKMFYRNCWMPHVSLLNSGFGFALVQCSSTSKHSPRRAPGCVCVVLLWVVHQFVIGRAFWGLWSWCCNFAYKKLY